MCEYPEVNWLPWQFKSPPRLWWVTLAESFYRGDPVAIAKTREYYETQEEPETGFPPSHPFEIYFGGVSSVRRVLFENKFAEVSSGMINCPFNFILHRGSLTISQLDAITGLV